MNFSPAGNDHRAILKVQFPYALNRAVISEHSRKT